MCAYVCIIHMPDYGHDYALVISQILQQEN
jgi:hypothetical protein